MLALKINRNKHAVRVGDAIVWPFVSTHRTSKSKGSGPQARYLIDVPGGVPVNVYGNTEAGGLRLALGLRPTGESMQYQDAAPDIERKPTPKHNRNGLIDFQHEDGALVQIGHALLTVCLKSERKPNIRVLVDHPRFVRTGRVDLVGDMKKMGDAPKILAATRINEGMRPSPLSVNTQAAMAAGVA